MDEAVEAKTEVDNGLVKPFDVSSSRLGLKAVLLPAGVILVIILAGSLTGYFLAQRGKVTSGPATTKKLIGGAELVSGPKEVGIKDVETFRDTAEGRLEINDNPDVTEGSHRLIRPGGVSKTAYLTSSVVDLNQFVGQCVQIWGETFAAQKAGWLMDVGRLKVLNNCPAGI